VNLQPYRALLSAVLYCAVEDVRGSRRVGLGPEALKAYRWIMALDDPERTFTRYCELLGYSPDSIRAYIAAHHGRRMEPLHAAEIERANLRRARA
jgi:hypothetical protein